MKATSLAILFTILLFYTTTTQAGPAPAYSDRYPKFVKIFQHGKNIYFAGNWLNRFIVAERKENGTWNTYTHIASDYNIDYLYVQNLKQDIFFRLVAPTHYCAIFSMDTKNGGKMFIPKKQLQILMQKNQIQSSLKIAIQQKQYINFYHHHIKRLQD